MVQTTEFGKSVKKRLVDMDKSQAWLIEQVREKTGLFMDSSYMHKILTGKLSTPKVMTAIRETLGLEKVN